MKKKYNKSSLLLVTEKKLTVMLNEDLLKALKVRAIEKGITLKEYIHYLINKELKKI